MDSRDVRRALGELALQVDLLVVAGKLAEGDAKLLGEAVRPLQLALDEQYATDTLRPDEDTGTGTTRGPSSGG